MPEGHAWRTTPGYKIVVADRGAARFDVPDDWLLVPDDTSHLCLADAVPPDDDVRLQFTVLPLPAVRAVAVPSAAELLREFAPTFTGLRGSVASSRRDGIELAWMECDDVDVNNGRAILSRTCLAVGPGRVALFTLACWTDRAQDFLEPWDVLRASLELGRSYDLSGRDPRRN